jgi:hypothetical protein
MQEPCPACGAIDFDEYRPFEDWRGGEVHPDGRTVPTPVVSCRVCGHEEAEGIVMSDVEPDSLRLTPIADPAEKFGPRPSTQRTSSDRLSLPQPPRAES